MNESAREEQTLDEQTIKIHPLNQLIKSDHLQYYKSQSSVTESLIVTFIDTLSAPQSEHLNNRLSSKNTVQATLKKQHLKQFSYLQLGTNTYCSRLVIPKQGFEHLEVTLERLRGYSKGFRFCFVKTSSLLIPSAINIPS